jgi:hypothetical protein
MKVEPERLSPSCECSGGFSSDNPNHHSRHPIALAKASNHKASRPNHLGISAQTAANILFAQIIED